MAHMGAGPAPIDAFWDRALRLHEERADARQPGRLGHFGGQ